MAVGKLLQIESIGHKNVKVILICIPWNVGWKIILDYCKGQHMYVLLWSATFGIESIPGKGS